MNSLAYTPKKREGVSAEKAQPVTLVSPEEAEQKPSFPSFSLNGEQARIAATQAAYVSRELWDKAQDDDRGWRSRTDIAMQQLLSKSEFQLYKETTNRALLVKEGEGRGIGLTTTAVLQFFSLLASVAAVVGVVFLAFRHS